VPEVAGKANDPDVRVLPLQGAKNGRGGVRASVIHIDQFEKNAGTLEDLHQSLVRFE